MNGRGVVLPPVEAGWFDLKQSITIDGVLARLQAEIDLRSAMSGERAPALFPPGGAARTTRFDGVGSLASSAANRSWTFARAPAMGRGVGRLAADRT